MIELRDVVVSGVAKRPFDERMGADGLKTKLIMRRARKYGLKHSWGSP